MICRYHYERVHDPPPGDRVYVELTYTQGDFRQPGFVEARIESWGRYQEFTIPGFDRTFNGDTFFKRVEVWV